MVTKSHVHIVGAGLIGTSIGLKVIESGSSVSMSDTNPDAEGLSRALMGRWSSPDQTPDIVIVSVPPNATARVIESQLDLHPSAIVVETSSTKANVELELRALSVDLSRVVLSHPLSGREVNGPSAARADLFLNRAWLTCPFRESSEQVIGEVESFIRGLGSTVYRMTSQEHDELLASISHLPQILSTAVAGKVGTLGSAASLAGQGLRDLTRLADSDTDLWLEILGANSNQVTKALNSLIKDLEKFCKAIDEDDSETIKLLFDKGRSGRALVSGKHGAVARDYAQCQVIIPDQPGALAKVFEICNSRSINIEDLSLEHSPAQETGLLTISINPQQAEILEKSLQESGFIFFFREKR